MCLHQPLQRFPLCNTHVFQTTLFQIEGILQLKVCFCHMPVSVHALRTSVEVTKLKGNKKPPLREVFLYTFSVKLFGYQTGRCILSIQTGNIADGNFFGTNSFTSPGIGTGTKSFFIHLRHHIHDTCFTFRITLWK